jgi:hypothetical protein
MAHGPINVKFCFNIIPSQTPEPLATVPSLRFLTKFCTHFFSPPHMPHALPISFLSDRPNNIWCGSSSLRSLSHYPVTSPPLGPQITPSTPSQHHQLLSPPQTNTQNYTQVAISSSFISVAMQLLLWPQRRTSWVRVFPQSLQPTQSQCIETGHDSLLSSFHILRTRVPVLNTGSKVTTAAHINGDSQ